MDFVSRADFHPRTRKRLDAFSCANSGDNSKSYASSCDNKEVARQAAKDRRVDLLNFPSLDYHKRFFDRAEAELASGSLAALEVDVKPLLVLEGPPRVRLLMSLRREVAVAREFHVPIVVSSGVGEERFMRFAKRFGKFSLSCLGWMKLQLWMLFQLIQRQLLSVTVKNLATDLLLQASASLRRAKLLETG